MPPPNLPSDAEDSRTASLPAQRARGSRHGSRSRSNHSSRHTSREPPNKRRRRSKGSQGTDVQDFVPRGASFSKEWLEVDPASEASTSGSESDSSDSGSGSDSDSDSSSASENDNDNEKAGPNMGVGVGANGVSAPAPNWNKTGRGVIRTSLRGRQTQAQATLADLNADASANSSANTNINEITSSVPQRKPVEVEGFEAVNGKYWRSRSASGSPVRYEEGAEEGDEGGDVETEDGEIKGDQSPVSGDSDDSGSLDSEADDSIMLNTIESRGETRSQNDIISISDEDSEGDGYDPEALPVSQPVATVDIFGTQNGVGDGSDNSKDGALRRFAQRYPAVPSVLADLDREDLELQAKIVFYNRDINDLDLQQPIMCTECLREGHHTEVCPMKECVHCGAWNQHQSTLCPKWRRCQRCRERGHDAKQCPSALKSSASEVPCDLCGSSSHLELDCDFLWKLPRQDTTAMPVLVSISCAHCTSNRHLIGDCPSLTRAFLSSSFTVRGIDPNVITNINSVVGARRGGPAPPPPPPGGLKIRGRAENHYHRFSSPESDDMMPMPRGGNGKRAPPGGNRKGNRGNINIRIGGNKNNGPPPQTSVRDYRDREDPYARNYNSRQRSMSPVRDRGRPGRGRGGSSGPRGGRGGGGGRGNGRAKRGGGGGGGGGGDAYRPMPSAGKKAWDKYRL
ncbi:zinc knuckle domain protein [Aspergillus undulatus]|uniref:zinc knuckle domain protein n=1 Tax=Aspergillus undulatus TaxID=1810928 RepID=UPI003CCCF3D1